MKILIFKYIQLLFFSLLVFSCTKDIETEEVILSRLFRPASFTASVNSNVVVFNWTPVGDGVYELELSKDSLLFTNELQTFSIQDSASLIIEDLWSYTRYSARIKSLSQNTTTKNSEWQEITFTTGLENLFYTSLVDENLGVDSVLLIWNKEKEVTHLVISTENADDITINLTETETTNGERLIENLYPNTPYTITIYRNEMPRGNISFTTKVENIFYNLQDEKIGVDIVYLNWDNEKVVSHLVLSSEGKDDEIIELTETDNSTGEKLLENLYPNTIYTIHLYLDHRHRGTVTFTTKEENIFYSLEDENIGVNNVLLNWDNEMTVSHLALSSEGIEDEIIELIETEISGGERLIENLKPGTSYTITIYFEDKPRGSVTFTTKSEEV